jgi:hypothetical protein
LARKSSSRRREVGVFVFGKISWKKFLIFSRYFVFFLNLLMAYSPEATHGIASLGVLAPGWLVEIKRVATALQWNPSGRTRISVH